MKKLRIVLSMTRLIYLLLLLLCTPESSESKIAKFGCLFDDTDFNLKLQSPGKAKFGETDPNKTMNFADDKSFETFLEKITHTYSDFFKSGLTYDSLSNYLGFYKTYSAVKHCPKFTKFSSFYAKYNAKYPKYEPGGNMITLMNKLVKDLFSQFPGLEQSIYFVTRSTIPEALLNAVIEEKSDALPDWFNHEQIAGIIKFQYPGNQDGYILLDPEIGAYKPVVFKNNEYNCHIIDGYNNDNIKFRIREPENKQNSASQIIAKVFYGSYVRYSYLYYYQKPFCSMVETMMKPSLLKFQHSREKRVNKLVKVGSFTAHVGLADPKGVPKNSDATVYDVEFKFLEPSDSLQQTNVYKTLRDSFPVMNVSTAKQYTKNIPEHRYERLGTSKNNLMKDMLLLQDIRNDVKFLKLCEYTLKDPENARSIEPVLGVDTSELTEKGGCSSILEVIKKFYHCVINNY